MSAVGLTDGLETQVDESDLDYVALLARFNQIAGGARLRGGKAA